MTLQALVKGQQKQPRTVLLYGVEGIGKSTFGASAPKPIFIDTEGGTAHLNVERFPKAESWTDVMDALRELTTAEHDYKTVVIDSLDHAEPLLWNWMCKRDGKANIEAYGFAKGYGHALDDWRIFIAAIERLRATKQMNVILLAHSWIKSFKNPSGDDFDRYELKLHNKAAGLLKEKVDHVLFANYETYAVKGERESKAKGVSSGSRFIYTNRTAAHDAKVRCAVPVPPSLPLSWDDFDRALSAGQDPEALTAEITKVAAGLHQVEQEQVKAALGRAGEDAAKLAQLLSWATAKAIEIEKQQQ
jgi:hypothetical protein